MGAIIYVTKDAERAAGIDLDRYPRVYILTNRSSLADLLHLKFPDRVFLNETGEPADNKPKHRQNQQNKFLSTLELLRLYRNTIEQIDKKPRILVFKNSSQIERLVLENYWQLLNPPVALAEKFERKISQYHWLKNLTDDNFRLPETIISTLDSLNYQELVEKIGSPFIVQNNIGHTGEGTKLVTSPYDLESQASATPQRTVKVSQYLTGQVFTVNACVCPNEIKIGRISLQLTGLQGFTGNPFSTVGNDWQAAQKLYQSFSLADYPAESGDLSNAHHVSGKSDPLIPLPGKNILRHTLAQKIEAVAKKVGNNMRLERWLGLFGVDILLEEKTNQLYLLEVNARQPASSAFETQLAHLQNAAGPMDWQVNSLADLPLAYPEESYSTQASQLFLRKKIGAIWEKFGQVSRTGEYDERLNLIEEKPLYDLAADNQKYFLIPQATSSEVVRIQGNNLLQKLISL